MVRILVSMLTGLYCLTGSAVVAAPASAGPSPETVDERVSTGFLIGADGTVVTTAHGVESCRTLQLADGRAPPQEARLVALDRRRDIAILSARFTRPVEPLAIRTDGEIRVGEAIRVLGFSHAGAVGRPSFATGVVSGLGGLHGDLDVLTVTVGFPPGMSGSAVLDSAGAVIAVAKAELVEDGRRSADMNFAVSGEALARTLKERAIAFTPAVRREAMAIEDIAEQARKATVAVKCIN